MSEMYTGNAYQDGPGHRGWIMGNFMPDGDIRNTNQFEVKWGSHTAGEARTEWVTDEKRTTICVLVQGAFTLVFRDQDHEPYEHTLKEPGDYAVWGPGVDHRWHADTDVTTITIRNTNH